MQGGRAPGKPRLPRGGTSRARSSNVMLPPPDAQSQSEEVRAGQQQARTEAEYRELLDRATLGEVRLQNKARRPSAPRTHTAGAACRPGAARPDNTTPT